MLTYFPSPYPDEWWYSVLCRYHVRSGHSKYATTISELYGGRPMVHGRLVPGGDCAVILSNLPSGVQSIDDVLQNHTLIKSSSYSFCEKETGGDFYTKELLGEGMLVSKLDCHIFGSLYPRISLMGCMPNAQRRICRKTNYFTTYLVLF